MKFRFIVLLLSVIFSCKQQEKKLPILGDAIVTGQDTVYPVIANFSLINQDSQQVTNKTFTDKIYVADFIFLSCPTICPKMTKAMHNAYKAFAADDRVRFISHTIDPENDSVPKLKSYAGNLGVSAAKWQFVTGNQDSIIKLAEKSYFSTAYPDSTAPGGFMHSGGLLLIDKDRHIRGVYNAINPEETQRLIKDITTLLVEQF